MASRPTGIGVDLVDLRRVRRFLQDHPKSFFRLLSPVEKKLWSARKPTALDFARLFAAKEAFFKALGGSWMGLEGFERFEVSCSRRSRFTVQSLPSGKCGEGRFFRVPNAVGAEVICWKNSDALAPS